MKRRIHIAFVGKAGSGKTTLSNELLKRTNFVKLSFAAPMYRIAMEILMRPIDKSDPLDRKFMQYLGTDLGRARQKDIWIQHLDRQLNQQFQMASFGKPGGYVQIETRKCNFVIDDCRFLNEAEYLKSKNFAIVKLIGRQREMTSENSQHASETEQDSIPVDFELDNSGSLDETMLKLLEGLETVDKSRFETCQKQ